MRRRLFALLLALGVAAAGHPRAQQAPPLPEAAAFLAAARARLASNARLQSRYTYKERTVALRLNPFGRMGTGPEEVYEVYPAPDPDLTYRRLVARGGAPVPAGDLAREDAEYLKDFEKWREELRERGTDLSAARQAELDAQRRKEEAQAREVLALFTFTLDRREQLGGEPAIVVRFAPIPGARPTSREAKVASRFAGEAWIHEDEHELMRLEGEALGDASFGWGLIARLHKGARVVVTRRRVNGVWLPEATHFTGTGRALLFRKVSFDYVHEYFDYEPFDVTDLPARLSAAGRRSK
ncbi:MAG: hypothetical protein AB7O67_10030 [Vicinamibacterales bacterium]